MLKKIINKIDKLNENLEKSKIYEISEILDSKLKLFNRSLLSGIGKGIGTGLGFYFITVLLIYILQYIVKLNIPILGKYISDIVDIVESSRK